MVEGEWEGPDQSCAFLNGPFEEFLNYRLGLKLSKSEIHKEFKFMKRKGNAGKSKRARDHSLQGSNVRCSGMGLVTGE